jgi:hypothetical protein
MDRAMALTIAGVNSYGLDLYSINDYVARGTAAPTWAVIGPERDFIVACVRAAAGLRDDAALAGFINGVMGLQVTRTGNETYFH